MRVSVLGGFRVETGDATPSPLPPAGRRLLAFLTSRRGPIARNVTAASLWPEASERHAAGNLRSALSRLSPPFRRAISVSDSTLAISDATQVDVWAARALAHRLLGGHGGAGEEDVRFESVGLLSSDLLPGWYDDWVLVAAEDWRQLRLHALESLVALLAGRQRFADAIGAALAAVAADPLRESPRGALIRVHLAEGNQTEALSEYGRYRDLLREELGLDPTEQLHHLVRDLRAAAPARAAPAPRSPHRPAEGADPCRDSPSSPKPAWT